MEQSEIRELRDELANHLGAILDARLSKMELNLVKEFAEQLKSKADAAVVGKMEEQLDSLERSRAAREHLSGDLIELSNRVSALERFRWTFPSAAAIAAIAAVAVAILNFVK